MKRICFFWAAAVLIFSCKQGDKHPDPKKQVEEGAVNGGVYVSNELGWTIGIPKGWAVVNLDETEANERKIVLDGKRQDDAGADASGEKHLISFRKDQFNSLMSTSEPFLSDSAGAFDDSCAALGKMIYDAYVSQGIRCDTSSSLEMIQGRQFHRFHARVYDGGGKVILQQLLYSRLIDKKDLSVTINYNNEEDKEVMMDAFRHSTFRDN